MRKPRLRAEAEQKRAEDLNQEFKTPHGQWQAERERRVAVEVQLASSEASAKALHSQVEQLSGQHTVLETSLASLQDQLDQARRAGAEAQRELATALAEAAAAKARADDLAERERQLRKDVERRDALLEQLRTPTPSAQLPLNAL